MTNKTVFLAVNIENDSDFDAIAFSSYKEMVEFCSIYDCYTPFETGLHSVKSALDLFGVEYNG